MTAQAPGSSAALTGGRLRSGDGTQLGYLSLGEGPLVVCLHGGFNSGLDWLPVARLLADRYRARSELTAAERAAEDRTWTFGHVIVDEAQELTPMAWRVLMRRCPSRSMTLVGDTAQTGGMRRFSAISGRSVGSERIWMGQTHVAPATASADHHHGASETAIHVIKGHPEFVFHDGTGEVALQTEPGDYVFIPPFVPHREENPDPEHPAVVVISRSTQEGIVVNLPSLTPLTDPEPTP